jgi:calcium-dependent protein kinase
VNNISKEIDISELRDAFRELDINNTGVLNMTEVKKALREHNFSNQELDHIFQGIDLKQDGKINYSVFLAATIDKH